MTVRFHEDLAGMFGPVDAAKPHPENPNNGDVEEIVRSIRANGCYRPVWVSKSTGHILGGHHLYEALVSEGCTEIPYLWLDTKTPEEEIRVLLADNAVARHAWIDPGLELALAQKLQVDSELGLYGSGVTEADVARMISEQEEELGDALRRGARIGDDETHVICPDCGHEFPIDINGRRVDE